MLRPTKQGSAQLPQSMNNGATSSANQSQQKVMLKLARNSANLEKLEKSSCNVSASQSTSNGGC